MDLLTSIKGIGVTLAAALIVATGGIPDFDNANQQTRLQKSGSKVSLPPGLSGR